MSTSSHQDQPVVPEAYYLPWTEGENNFSEGIAFGKGLARASGLPLEVGMPQLSQFPDGLAKLAHFTERSRSSLRTPRVALLLHPTFKLMSHGLPRDGSKVVVVEFPTNKLHGWAAFEGALNLKTKETMAVQPNAPARKLFEQIEFNGINGWADKPGKRDALRDLAELKSMGELDFDILRGYFLARKSDTAVDRLIKIADQVMKKPK